MKKTIITIVSILIVLAIIIAIVVLNQKPKTKLAEMNSAEDLAALVKGIYKGMEDQLPSLMTQTIDVNDADMVKMTTGLENGNNLEYAVVSEPMMSSQAYSLVIAKVKDGVNANEIAKLMSENVNTRKWICVSAEKVYATSSGNIAMLVMADEDWAKPVYEKFKSLAENVDKEYEKTEKESNIGDFMVVQ